MSGSLPAVTLPLANTGGRSGITGLIRKIFHRAERSNVAPFDAGFAAGLVVAKRLRPVLDPVVRLAEALERLKSNLASSDPASNDLVHDIEELYYDLEDIRLMVGGLDKVEYGPDSEYVQLGWNTAYSVASGIFKDLDRLGGSRGPVALLLEKISERLSPDLIDEVANASAEFLGMAKEMQTVWTPYDAHGRWRKWQLKD